MLQYVAVRNMNHPPQMHLLLGAIGGYLCARTGCTSGALAIRYVTCVAVCCSVVQCVAVRCSVLQCVAVRGNVLQCVAVCCGVSGSEDRSLL